MINRTLLSTTIIFSALFSFCFVSLTAQPLPNPVIFCTQVPNPNGFGSLFTTFGNHLGSLDAVTRGGDLYIRYPNGTLKNLTQLGGYGNAGDSYGNASQQGANGIAVRDPCVHWDGNKVVFSMVIGGATQQYQVNNYYWQLYEVTGLGINETPVITKVRNQPANYNNVYPIYDSNDRIIFTSDRPRDGSPQLYPQRDEYESAPVTSGVWRLDPSGCPGTNLTLLTHAPSGDFSPFIDSYGRVMFSRWDHLQRDQQADADIDDNAGYGSFNYTNENANATPYSISPDVEVFPEPRQERTDILPPHVIGQTFNIFNPWTMHEDGTDLEILNHLGRHDLQGYFEPNFDNDPNLVYFNNFGRYNPNNLYNFHQIRESKTQPGLYYGVDCQEFSTHAAGMIASMSAPPGLTADSILVNYITHPDTRSADDTPSPNHSGLYRDPTPLMDGRILVVHSSGTREDANIGTSSNPLSRFNFKLQLLQPSGNYQAAAAPLMSDIVKAVSWWSPDMQRHYNGALWETFPVEVVVRTRPAFTQEVVPAIEQAIFDSLDVDIVEFKKYLRRNNLALIVSRDVTSRDDADRQQPFNLHVSNTSKQTINPNHPNNIYNVKFFQLIQGDQLRGYGGMVNPYAGRRVIGQYMHDSTAVHYNPVSTGAQGSVNIKADGSIAAIVPAGRAMSWQLTDSTNSPIVRERVWLSFVPGETRVCTSCHGENKFNQAGQVSPTNPPQALYDLLNFMKNQDSDSDGRADIYDGAPLNAGQQAAQPVNETFVNNLTNWLNSNGGNDNVLWQAQNNVACNQTSAVANNFISTTSGNVDKLYRVVDLREYSVAILNFDVAYARYSNNRFDGLRVKVMTCDSVVTTVYDKSGTPLATAPDQTTAFSPADCGQWRTECLDLSAYAGQSFTLIFENVCGRGNKLYLDNIKITESPPAPVFSGDSNLCNGETSFYQITSGYLPGTVFTWTVTGGNIISGQGTATIQVQWTGNSSGSVSVTNQ